MDGVVDVLAIQALNADFAHHFDRDEVEAVLALFTADAVYDNGRRRCEGREALAAYLRERTASGPRTTRHFYSGLRVAFEGAERAAPASGCPMPATPRRRSPRRSPSWSPTSGTSMFGDRGAG